MTNTHTEAVRPAWFSLPDDVRARLVDLEDAVRANEQLVPEAERDTQAFLHSVALVREARHDLANAILAAWDAR
ncbi:hypothetical protein ACVW2K_004502 [Nocardioides sp. HB32]